MIQRITNFLLTFLCFVLFSWTNNALHAQDKPSSYYSYTPDGVAKFNLSREKALVAFREGITLEEQSALFQSAGIFKPFGKEMNLPSPKVTIAEILPGKTEKEILQALAILKASDDVIYANPFLVYSDGTLHGIQNRFAVKLKSAADYSKLDAMARNNGAIIKEKYEYDPLLYFIEVSKTSAGNALELANKFAESKIFQSAETDFLRILKKFNTNDTYLNYQWALNNTGSAIQYSGTAGADMNVFSAWGISTGNASTKVAIIDEGVDLAHPDLVGNMLSGYDGTGQGSGGAPSGDDAHGTSCAGIVAATGNNNLGVAGVAYNAKIVPVRIAYSSGSSWITTDAWIGASIDWAWNQGDADVLSNSWGGGASSSLINDPIGRAVTQGRGGLGSVVLFAAGNDNGSVSYPATLTNVIAVAAMSMCNQRKNPSSCDGETWWGSNYGSNVDIAAPGVKIYTTDISGGSGYSSGDYVADFNGTSSACPNAAGVMALILATNSALTQSEARQIIESTCVKVGGYTYNSNVSGQPNGTWSTDLGYGRVNALAALQLANPVACTNPPAAATTVAGPSSFCTAPASISLSLTGITFGTGQTYQWQSSTDNVTYTNISDATLQLYNATISSATWFRCLVTCGSTTASIPVQVTFSDPTITTFPHSQNFDGQAGLPCGWTVQNVNGDPNTWVNGTNNPRSAPNAMQYNYNTAAAADDWLFTAPLSLTAGTNYQVTFWYRAQSASYPEALEVKWGNAANAASMSASPIFTNSSITNTTYAQGTASVFTPSTSGIYYVGFHAISAADMWILMLDDVTISAAATCAVPNVGGTASGPGTMTAGTAGTFNLTGFTGSTINWQASTNGGVSFSDISGATTASSSISLAIGTYLIRARVSSLNCVDAFSNTLNVTVNPRPGDNLSIAIPVATPYSTTLSTATGSGFTSQYTGTNAQSSPDVFFVITTGPCTDSLRITTCTGTSFDSYLHLLNSAGTNITSVDDNGPYCTGTQASMKVLVSPNTTYYIVVEGFGAATGTFQLDVTQIDNPVFAATVTPSGSTTFCAGGSVTLTSSAASSYLWSNGATTQAITVTSADSYSVVATNAAGCSASSSAVTVTVNSNPAALITPSGPTTFCAGGSVTLTASGGTSYSWSTGATTAAINVSTSGNYFVVATNANGCQSQANQFVTVSPSVVPSVGISLTGGSNPSCAGSAMTFTASAINGGTTPAYQWQVNGINVGTNSSTYSTTSLTNGQNVTCILTSNVNCASPTQATSNSITAVINSPVTPAVSIALTSGSNPACAGSSLTFTAVPTNGGATPSYQWKVNGSNVGTNSSTYTTSGLTNGQTVTCEMTSNATCVTNNLATSNGITVTVNPILTPSVSIALTTGNNPTCAGSSLTFTATPVNGGANPAYQWKINGGNVGTNSPTFSSASMTNGQIVTCELTSNAPCASTSVVSSNSITVTVNSNLTWYADSDNDGYGNLSITSSSCTQPVGFVANSLDCNDALGSVNPAATEICNGIDDDCDTFIDEGFDNDNDGYSTCEGDCNDNNNAIHPGATEICNGVDDDCDTLIDENTSSGCVVCISGQLINTSLTWYQDSDNDGFGNSLVTQLDCVQPNGYVSVAGDCNDNNGSINPNASEICNNLDDDCDGLTDEGFDTDNDGYTTCEGDCNDNNAGIHPGTTEICGNGIDDNCDGNFDGDSPFFDPNFETQVSVVCSTVISEMPIPQVFGSCPSDQITVDLADISSGCAGGVIRTFGLLRNGDVVASAQQLVTKLDIESPFITCPSNISIEIPVGQNSAPVFFTGQATDNCTTFTQSFTPASGSNFPVGTTVVTFYAEDACGNFSTCTFDVVVSNAASITYYEDSDGDGYGNPAVSTQAGSQPNGYVLNNLDCNDSNNAVNPAATEICNGIDDDCDNLTDEGFDNDNDGFTSCAGDCNDNNAAVHPGATEVCNSIDDDCDGSTDEGLGQTWYADNDNDGYGNTSITTVACSQPNGYVALSGDCNDNDNAVRPNAVEVCNNIDDDCDGNTDEGFDNDNDGYTSCEGDCNDNNSAVNPGATEICNNVDDDCDGNTDEGLGQTWYVDSDNDGYGNALTTTVACTQPMGYVAQAGDCNDNNSAVNPGATEICSNGIDEDCDGVADDGCPTVPNDLRPNAISLAVSAYNTCNSTAGNLTLATTSPESQSTALTGQDLWYSFVALSPGAQIKVSTTAINVLVELQNSAGVMIDSENIQSTKSNENLNIGSLTPGQTYFVAVRNYNSAQGTGAFNICISDLPASGCLTPAPSYTMCSKFKAIVVNAANYVYNFTSTQTNITYSRTQPSAILDLYKVTGGMPTGANYTARVDAVYNVLRGNGTTESITVQATSTCQFLFAADPLLVLATTQDCPSPRPLGANIRSNTTVCYASVYQWEFQKADLSEPAFTIMGGSTQYLLITSAMGFVPGTTYNVRIRVTYQNGYTNPWGPVSCLLIAGGAGMSEYQPEEDADHAIIRVDDSVGISIYPNPGNGEMVNLELDGIESELVDVYLTDAMGKILSTKQYFVEGYLQTQWVFDTELSAGLYLINVVYNGKNVAQRIIVE